MKNANKKRTNFILYISLVVILIGVIAVGTIRDKHISADNAKEAIKVEKNIALSNQKLVAAENKKYPYKDKKWDAIGDSITALNVYQGEVQNLTQLSPINSYGIAGTSITAVNKSDTNAICNRIDNIDHSANIISIFGGTNDWATNKPLGNKNSTSVTTFYGALKTMITKIKAENPKAKIMMFTPLQRNSHAQGQPAGMGANLYGYTLIDYANAIKDVAQANNVPVLDLYNVSGITVQNIDQYTKDGLLPNDVGFQMVSKVISAFIDKQ